MGKISNLILRVGFVDGLFTEYLSSETVVVISFKHIYNLISADKGSTIWPQHLLLMSADVGAKLCCSNLQRLGSESCPYDLMLGANGALMI